MRFYDARQKDTKLNEEAKNGYVLLFLLKNWILFSINMLAILNDRVAVS